MTYSINMKSKKQIRVTGRLTVKSLNALIELGYTVIFV